jgi:pyruvyltransferase
VRSTQYHRFVRKIPCYFWRDVPNFGDRLTPLLLQRFAGVEGTWVPPQDAQIIVAGSVIGHMPVFWAGTILGAGFLRDNERVPYGATALAVRGPRTAALIGGPHTVLGDPGLLANELTSPVARTNNLGVLPHWTDKDLTARPEFRQYNPVCINPRNDPLAVIRAIASCKKLVTSSLHGLIVADAFGIPRRFELPPRKYQHASEHSLFKFLDYHESIGMEFRPGVTASPVEGHVRDRQHELYDVFRDYGSSLRRWP